MWDALGSDPCGACETSRINLSLCHDMKDPYSDKENLQPFGKNEELSLYDNGISPLPCTSCSPSHCPHETTQRRSLDDQDTNSQDSGYSASYRGEKFSSYASPNRTSFGGSSLESMEDDFMDFADVEPLEKLNLPQDFNKLIAKPLLNRPKLQGNKCSPSGVAVIRPLFRRALSLQNPPSENITPNSSRVRTSLFRGPDEIRCFKRPDPPSLIDTGVIKKSKMFDSDEEEASVPVIRPVLQRAFSATEESIMCAVHRSSTEPDLIGDFSRGFSLPLTISRHQDLKAITPHTLSKLMKGEFNESIASFKVIDCRYPYEFEGGHIEGAINIYTKEKCIELLNDCKAPVEEQKQRHVLVFHCEFSSERGPNLYRYLRKEDRQRNVSAYPSLFYPEIYLLEGGYKHFFEQFANMCTPIAYKEMLHPDHEEDLKHFRQKSKTWNCDSRQRSQHGRNLKRLEM